MNQTCQNCKKEFVIDTDNQDFCNKIHVPYPTWCPNCRMVRRMSFPNAWSIYFKKCDKCGEKTMSMHPPDTNLTVYCQPCWWSDSWDGTEYGVDYDPSRSFLEQWRELQLQTPQCALETTYLNLTNSDYSNAIAYAKNSYLVFWADYCENVYHSSILNTIKDSSDLLRCTKTELCYNSVGLGNCSKTFFSDTCDDCVDVWFSRNCYGCMNCIGCVNLRGQNYMIFNKKYSKDEYFEKLKVLGLDTNQGILNMKKDFSIFEKKFPYREYNGNAHNVNTSGDYIFNSKNTQNSYMCVGTEDSRFTEFVTVPTAKDCYDYSGWGNSASLIYECGNVGENVSNCKFSYFCFPDVLNVEYSMWCIGAKNNFGCANLKRKQYAILNKVYDKETYEKLVNIIREDMIKNPYTDKNGRIYAYGEFFPSEFSLFPYNDSNAMKFIPKTKEDALIEGYTWRDKTSNTYIPTLSAIDLPKTIKDTTDSLLNEIIECRNCLAGYKIASGEYTILKKINLPIPDMCPKCRETERFEKINKPFLRDAICDKCHKNIQTAHDREKIVYCISCYQQELI